MKKRNRRGGRPDAGTSRVSRERPLERGAVFELEITRMALDGDALGTVGDYVVFVEGTIPGERVQVRALSASRKFARAKLLRVVRPSPHRIAPRCRHFGPCGGCTWQHISYGEQLRLKESMLSSILAHALGKAPGVRYALGIEDDSIGGGSSGAGGPWGFRNKVHFVLGREKARDLVMGHYQRRSRSILEIEECPVHSERGNRVAFRIRELLEKYRIPGTEEETPGGATGRGEARHGMAAHGAARHIVIRVSEATSRARATLVVTDRRVPRLAQLAHELERGPDAPYALHLNVHDRPGPFLFGPFTTRVYGDDRLEEKVAGATFLVSPKAFFQTSVRSAAKLVEVVLGFVPQGEEGPILDLYAGAGLFSIPLARRGERVTAVEENPVAVRDGVASLKASGVDGDTCRFIQGRVEDVLRDLPRRFGTVILDPPREGCPPSVLEGILRGLRPARILYVSCNPRALASELGQMVQRGYAISEVQPVDMFPHTAHIEAVALLECQEP